MGVAAPRLLVVNIYFAPEETGIAPYNVGLTTHLAARGWDVTMLTGMPHFPQWRTWPAYRSAFRARETKDGVDVRRVRHTARGGSLLGRAMYEGTFLAQALTVGFDRRPDAVLAVIPNLTSGVAGALHARRFGVPFGVIVQDLTGAAAGQSGLPGGGRATAPVRAIEGWILRQARRVGIISETFRRPAEAAGADPAAIVPVPNWCHVQPPSLHATDHRSALGWPADAQVVLHAGNMGFKQCLESVLDAAQLAAARGLPLHFVLMGDGNQRPRLETLARDRHVGNLQFLDLQPADAFMDVLAAADVLLVNERSTVHNMSLPSKITSYLRAGRPVVAAVPPGGSTAAMLAASGAAVLVAPEDPAALLDGLTSVLGDPSLRAGLVAKGLAYVDEHLDQETLLRRAEAFVADLVDAARVSIPPSCG